MYVAKSLPVTYQVGLDSYPYISGEKGFFFLFLVEFSFVLIGETL